MKKTFTILIFLISGITTIRKACAQQNTWDPAATTFWLHENIKENAQHISGRNNQIKSQATVSWWKSTTNKYKALEDTLNKRLTAVYIVTQDASLLQNMFQTLSDVILYQQKIIPLAKDNPQAGLIIVNGENDIYNDMKDLILFTVLVVNSVSDISKMKTSDRLIINNAIQGRLNKLDAASMTLYSMISMIDFQRRYKESLPATMINNDKQIVKDILNQMKP